LRTLPILLICIVIAASGFAVGTSDHGPHDPCDSYGDCIAYSISPSIHSNPDGTYYPGDVFTFNLATTEGPNTTGYSASWSFDPSEFSRSGETFSITGNKTGTFSISATVSFDVDVNGTVIVSKLTATESVRVIQLVLSVSYGMVNVTDPMTGLFLRNPDGSFYHNDSFCVQWSASFKFSSSRDDIFVNATGSLAAYLTEVSANSTGKSGMICYSIRLDAPYHNSTLIVNFGAFNWMNVSIGHSSGPVPFAVVRYSPMFASFTYMEYNAEIVNGANSSSYQRPFATLIRYGGNAPSYNYTGDANTEPFLAGNSTGERALINNYTFVTEGFNPVFYENQGSPFRFGFNDDGRVEVNITSTNKTTTALVDWGHRVVKYYFSAPVSDFRKLAPFGIEYLNVTERVYSRDFAGGTYDVVNSSYRYEPIFYDGYLVFHALDQHGNPDPNVNVTVTVLNPNPLGSYLTRKVVSIFGNDSQVLKSFRKDLYAANATAEVLKPRLARDGTWEFAVNQTNLGMEGEPPSAVQVTVNGHGTIFVYSFSNAFSLYVISSLPVQSGSRLIDWQNIAAYTFGQNVQFRSMPLTFNFSTPTLFLSWSGLPEWSGAFLPPVYEPGTYSLYYPFLYGMNNTVVVNLEGGGAAATSTAQGASVYTTIYINQPSGGARSFWVRDGNGTRGALLFSAPLLDNLGPPAPSGFEGATTFAWPPDRNGTVTLGIVNSFGVSVPIGYYQAMVHAVKGPSFDDTLLLGFLLIAAGFVLLGKAINRGSEGREAEPDDSTQ
jgi:hypothetical protein